MRRLSLAAALLSSSALAGPVPVPGVSLDANGKLAASKTYTPQSLMQAIGQNVVLGVINNASSNTAFNETTRIPFTTTGAVHHLWLYFPVKIPATGGNAGSEANAANQVFHKAAIECPTQSTSTSPLFSLQGQTLMQMDNLSVGGLTDPLGYYIPANTSCYIRYETSAIRPPATTALSLASGGSLAIGTTLYYKATCAKIGPQGNVESGPGTEQSITPTSGNQTVLITNTASANTVLPCGSMNIYRGTATNAETYLTSIQSPGLTFSDNGSFSTTAGTAPPAQQVYTLTDYLISGMTSNTNYSGSGNQADAVLSTGALAVAGPTNANVATPVLIADDPTAHAVCGIGDSIESGTGILDKEANLAGGAATHANWFVAGLAAAGFNNVINMSLPTTRISSLVGTSLPGASLRTGLLDYCVDVFDETGTNDIATQGATWQATATNKLLFGQTVRNAGKRYFIGALFPRGSTTDNAITLTNQTPAATESQRANYNSWVRGGFRTSDGTVNGTPVLSGGTPATVISGYWDMAQALPEVNSSGVTTMNGGYWPVPASPVSTGTVLTGSPTTNTFPVSGTPYTLWANVGEIIKITSGAANGQTCQITTQTTSQLQCSASQQLSTSPAAGDTFSLYHTSTAELVHPTSYQQNLTLKASFAAWAIANLTPF